MTPSVWRLASLNAPIFFTWFFELLKKQPEVKDRRTTEKVFVPVIMNYDGIKNYSLFVRLASEEIFDNFDWRDDILQNMDTKVYAFTERLIRMTSSDKKNRGA
jgi:poly(A) polymerase Pap1